MIVVTGLLGHETILSPNGERATGLGGAGLYAALACANFCPTTVFGVVSKELLSDISNVLSFSRSLSAELDSCPTPGFSYSGAYASPIAHMENAVFKWGTTVFHNYSLDRIFALNPKGILHAVDDPLKLLGFSSDKVKAVRRGLCVNANFIEHFSSEYSTLISALDYAFMNVSEFDQLGDAARGNLVVVTENKAPVKVYCNGVLQKVYPLMPCSSYSTDCDPTGCGDVFAGALFAQMLKYDLGPTELDEAVQQAHLIALSKLQSRGALNFAKLINDPL